MEYVPKFLIEKLFINKNKTKDKANTVNTGMIANKQFIPDLLSSFSSMKDEDHRVSFYIIAVR